MNFVSANSNGLSQQVDAQGVCPGDLVMDLLTYWKAGGGATPNSSQTQEWNISSDGSWYGACSIKKSNAIISDFFMKWVLPSSSDQRSILGAVVIKEADNPVQANATETQTVSNGSSLTWSHLVSANSNRLLVVGISMAAYGSIGATGITCGGVALTKFNSAAYSTGSAPTIEFWYLLNPPVGNQSIVATLSGNAWAQAGSIDFWNVNQSNPLANYGLCEKHLIVGMEWQWVAADAQSIQMNVTYEKEVIPVQANATATQTVTNGSSLTWTHVIGSNSNRLLVVGVSEAGSGAISVSGVTCGGVALTKFNSAAYAAGSAPTIEFWYLVNPTAGSQSIVVTLKWERMGRSGIY